MMQLSNSNHRRKRRIAARKEQILQAAAAVFSEKGYAGATTREIAATADLSEGTLYNYFRTKEDLLIGLAKEYADDVIAEIEALESDDIADLMTQLLANRFRGGHERQLFMVLLHEARHHPDVYQFYVQEALGRINETVGQRFQQHVDAGTMRPVNTAVVARTISAVVLGYGMLVELGVDIWDGLSLDEAEAHSATQLGSLITDIFLHGLQEKS